MSTGKKRKKPTFVFPQKKVSERNSNDERHSLEEFILKENLLGENTLDTFLRGKQEGSLFFWDLF